METGASTRSSRRISSPAARPDPRHRRGRLWQELAASRYIFAETALRFVLARQGRGISISDLNSSFGIVAKPSNRPGYLHRRGPEALNPRVVADLRAILAAHVALKFVYGRDLRTAGIFGRDFATRPRFTLRRWHPRQRGPAPSGGRAGRATTAQRRRRRSRPTLRCPCASASCQF